MSPDKRVWINGEVVGRDEARIDIEDRGFQFADGIYEVVRIYHGRPFALAAHLQRLGRSAEGIGLALRPDVTVLAREIEAFITRHAPADSMLYLQATRGPAPRNHQFPAQPAPTLLFYAKPLPPPGEPAGSTVRLLSVKDERWSRCWIKSMALLANVLAKNQALAAGADEAVFVDGPLVHEGSASNILAVREGRLIAPPAGPRVLGGITRGALVELCPRLGIEVAERPLTEQEALAAEELLITSTTREVAPVVAWDGRPVGGGVCGPVTRRLAQVLRERIEHECREAR
jgi:D-alanine transaminase